MTSISVINTMPSNKIEVHRFVKSAKEIILSGNENPLKIAMQLKAMETTIEDLRKDPEIRDAVLKEAAKYGKTFKLYGAEFQTKEAGIKYDYSVCGDSEWIDLNKKMEALKKDIQDREKFLKGITESVEVADVKTGEILNPPAKKSTTVVTVELL